MSYMSIYMFMTYMSILNLCYDGIVHTYATTKEMKTIEFRINSQIIKEKFWIQMILISEIKSRIERF